MANAVSLPSLAATLPAMLVLSAPSDSSLFDSGGRFNRFCDPSSRGQPQLM